MSDNIISTLSSSDSCDYRSGTLPSCAPLAGAYVPMQQSSLPKYDTEEAIFRGTLFPGLDLPFKNIANNSMPNTPLGELMALDFVIDELGLYLNTHSSDAEAFTTYQSFLKLRAEGHKRYAETYGPISKMDMLGAKSYTWTMNPWPWDFSERTGG